MSDDSESLKEQSLNFYMKVKRVQCEMIADRKTPSNSEYDLTSARMIIKTEDAGYQLSLDGKAYYTDEEQIIFNPLLSIEDFENYYVGILEETPHFQPRYLSAVYYSEDKESTIAVIYLEREKSKEDKTDKVKIAEFRPIQQFCLDYPEIENLIIISPSTLCTDPNKEFQLIRNSFKATKKGSCQFFLESELKINPSYHITVPKYIRLTEEEKIKFLRDSNVTVTNLKELKTEDIIVRYFGFLEGDLIKILRRNAFPVTVISEYSIDVKRVTVTLVPI